MMCAAYKGQLEVVRLLIGDGKADVNAKDRKASTAWTIAAQNERLAPRHPLACPNAHQ